jgi:hypothetical protein
MCASKGASIEIKKSCVKTHFASKVSLFQETVEFKHVIVLCYGDQ